MLAVPFDLSHEQACVQLARRLEDERVAVEVLVNNRPAPGKRQPEHVAKTVIKALRGHGPAVVDDRFNTVQAFVFGHLLPSRTAARITGQFFRKAALEN